MKKKITCLVMSLLLVFSAINLFACSSKKTEEDDANKTESYVRNPMTLSLWIPTYDGTSQESIKLVEEALNKISRAQFSTAIELHLIPSESYEAYARRALPGIYPEMCYDYTNCNGIVMTPVLLEKSFFGSPHVLVMMDEDDKHALSFTMFCKADNPATNDVSALVSRIMNVFSRKYNVKFKRRYRP